MVIRRCLVLVLLSSGSSFVLMPKNATGRVAGDLTLLKRYAYRWDMPEESTLNLTLTLTLALALARSNPAPCRLQPSPSSLVPTPSPFP